MKTYEKNVDPPFHNFNFRHLLYQGLIKIKSTPPTKLWWWFDFLFKNIFPLFGEMIQFDDIIFFRWVVSTTNHQKKIHPNTSRFARQSTRLLRLMSRRTLSGREVQTSVRCGREGRGDYIWANYSDLTRPHPKWWFSKGNPLISGKSRLVKYYNLARLYVYTVLKVDGATPKKW